MTGVADLYRGLEEFGSILWRSGRQDQWGGRGLEYALFDRARIGYILHLDLS